MPRPNDGMKLGAQVLEHCWHGDALWADRRLGLNRLHGAYTMKSARWCLRTADGGYVGEAVDGQWRTLRYRVRANAENERRGYTSPERYAITAVSLKVILSTDRVLNDG